MGRRLLTTLVCFGVRTDAAEKERLDAAPVNGWPAAAVVVAVLCLLGLIVGLALLVSGTGSARAAIGGASLLFGAFMALRADQIATRSSKHRAIGASGWRLLGFVLVVSGAVQVLAAVA